MRMRKRIALLKISNFIKIGGYVTEKLKNTFKWL